MEGFRPGNEERLRGSWVERSGEGFLAGIGEIRLEAEGGEDR